MSFEIGEIVWFSDYQFNDGGKSRDHYGLILLPEKIWYENSVYSAVITSKKQNWFCLLLPHSKYTFLPLDSYLVVRSQDFVQIDYMDVRKQIKKGSLFTDDLQKTYKLLRSTLYHPKLPYLGLSKPLKATIIREWKKKLGLI